MLFLYQPEYHLCESVGDRAIQKLSARISIEISHVFSNNRKDSEAFCLLWYYIQHLHDGGATIIFCTYSTN